MIKPILAVLLSLVLLSGCTAKDTRKVIEFSTWGSASELAVIKRVIKDYETANCDVRIKLQHIPQNYFKKLHLLLASATEPDVMLVNNQNIVAYGEYFLTLDKGKFEGEYYPNAIKALSLTNELKAAPRDVSTLVVYYNKSLLKDLKIPLLDYKWSFDDFMKISEQLKKNGVFSLPLENDLFYLYPFILSFGEDAEGITAQNLSSYKSVKFFNDLIKKYHYAPFDYQIGTATPAEFFLSEKSAFFLSGRWMTPKIREVANFDWDVVNFPMAKMGSIVPCDATGWAISKRSDVKKEAIAFVEYLTSDDVLRQMSESGLIVPARVSSSWSKEFLTTPPNNMRLFLDLAKNSKTIVYPKDYNRMRDEINTNLKAINR